MFFPLTHAKLQGAGTTQAQQNYTYVDVNASTQGIEIYYRLEQVYTDGTTETSSIKLVQFADSATQSKVFPNPARQGEAVVIQSKDIQNVEIYTSTGKVVKQITVDKQNATSIATDNLASGVYIIRVNGKENYKLVVE